MELFPELKLALFNGWIFLILFYVLQFVNLKFVSKQMSEKLFDRSNFNRKQWIFTFISKIFGVAAMILIFFLSLMRSNAEWAGQASFLPSSIGT